MRFFGKIFHNFWFKFALLILGYFLTRLINLTLLPIFTDEAIYIRWAQIGSQDAAWRFISLVDGKQPLFTWILMVLLKFIRDPLWAGRFVSVVAGAISLVGVYLVAQELFHKRAISLWTGVLYILSPFSLMYDRLALYDSLVATFSIWNLYLAILLVRQLRLDIALGLGMTLGAGILNKSSGFLSLYFLPLTLLLFSWREKRKLYRFIRWFSLILLAVIISQFMYNILRLSPLFHMISQKDNVFVYSLAEWLTHPFTFWRGNLNGLLDWIANYLTKPIFGSALVAALIIWKRPRELLLLLAWWFAPFIVLALFGKVLYPRFILFASLPLFILAGISLNWLITHHGRRVIGLVVLFFVLFPSLSIDYFIMTNPRYALIPRADKGQLIDDWPSGGGIKEVNTFLLEEAKHGKILVYTEGTFGLMPYALEIYLIGNPNIKIQGIWPLPQVMPSEIGREAVRYPSYLITNQSQLPPPWPLTLLREFQKGNRTDRKLRLYQILPALAHGL